MSWMQRALETYEQNSKLAGKVREGEEPLLPIAHMVFKAQLEITINQDGAFRNVEEVDKKNCSTIIPVTESSGGRSGKYPPPHPLCDTLSYIAGDFSNYSDTDCSWKYEAYLNGLQQWAESEYTHPKVQAIYKYVAQGTIMQDLIRQNYVTLTENNKLDTKKIQGCDYEKVLVRFRIVDADHTEEISATWEDITLMEAYIDYYNAIQTGKKDLCYLTGKEAVITTNHPKGIVAADYGAKLISANDTTNFTFRGRFAEATEACVVSYEASQKAHAALSWLSRNQGVTVGNTDKRTYIAWTVSGKEVKPVKYNLSAFRKKAEETEEPPTIHVFKKKLRQAFAGYANTLKKPDGGLENVYIIGLDAATTGRLSVTYYNELAGSEFLERLKYWELSCKWYHINNLTGKIEVITPTIPEIVKHAFGIEKENFIELDDRILKEQTERLMHCMVNQQQIPRDLMHALFVKASELQRYKNWWNRENVLTSACAIIVRYHCYDHPRKALDLNREGVDFDMELNQYLEQDRSYLFGKLLAIVEQVEMDVLRSKEENRDTNAMRLQSAFVSHPMTTWKTLEGLLNPYYRQLHPEQVKGYKTMIEDIITSLTACCGEKDEQELNRTLEETYLLGYYLQRKDMRNKEGN